MSDDTDDGVQPAGTPEDTKEADVKRQHREAGGGTLPDDETKR